MRISFLISFFFGSQVLASIKCFGNSEQISKIEVNDCAEIFEIMLNVDKVWAPMHFTRDGDEGYQVPHRWHKRSCTVLIDMLEDEDDDVFPFGDIIRAASNIVRACVMEPRMPGLGGRDIIGPKEKMLLVVGGIKVPQNTVQNMRYTVNASHYLTLPVARNISTF